MMREELLKELQGERTQTEFAIFLGISQAQVSRLLSGKRDVGTDVLASLLRNFPEQRDQILAVFLHSNKTNQNDTMQEGINVPIPQEAA